MFWEKFNDLCRKRKISLRAVSTQLNIFPATLQGFREGKLPNAGKLKEIADFFGVSCDYLLDDNDTWISITDKSINNNYSVYQSHSFSDMKSLPQRWRSVCYYENISDDEIYKISEFTGVEYKFLLEDSSYLLFSGSWNNRVINLNTLELILGIMDACPDNERIKTVQIQLSRLVIYWIEKAGFHVMDEAVNWFNDNVFKKILWISSPNDTTEEEYRYGLNFSDLVVLQKMTDVSLMYMFTGMHTFATVVVSEDNTESKKPENFSWDTAPSVRRSGQRYLETPALMKLKESLKELDAESNELSGEDDD